MTPEAAAVLRHAAAHVLVADVTTPELDEATAHHVFRVLRVRDGAVVTVTDGRGTWRACRAQRGVLEPVADPAFEPRRTEPVTIACAIPKSDRPDWIVQKLTEIGVDRIVLLHAERSVVRWEGERAVRHLDRLRIVSGQALQQSRGVWVPEITGPVPALEVLPAAVAAEPSGRRLERGDRAIAIGPEGGWTDAELATARATVSLGAGVLRVETAAVAAAVLSTM